MHTGEAPHETPAVTGQPPAAAPDKTERIRRALSRRHPLRTVARRRKARGWELRGNHVGHRPTASLPERCADDRGPIAGGCV